MYILQFAGKCAKRNDRKLAKNTDIRRSKNGIAEKQQVYKMKSVTLAAKVYTAICEIAS